MVLTPTKQRISRAFGLKATTYNASAGMQTRCIDRLLSITKPYIAPLQTWADFGCGTGLLLRTLAQWLPQRAIGVDLSFELASLLKKNNPTLTAIQADIDTLPFKPNSFDGIAATSVLQWSNDSAETVWQISRLLKPGGYYAFSVFTKGSLAELFAIRAQFNLHEPVFCPHADAVKSSLDDAMFEPLHMDEFTETVYFPAATLLLKNLSALGATATADKRLNRAELSAFCAAYESTFRIDRGVPLSYCIFLGLYRKRA